MDSKTALWFFLAVGFACLADPPAFGQFYYPDQKEYQSPDKFGLKYETVTFESKDGTKLHGWFVPATVKALGTVVHYHGNAQNLSAHFSFVHWLPQQGFNLFVFDYRGYGKSEGVPTRQGVHEDGIAALRYLKTRTDIAPDKLLVLGQSLGGAVAIGAVAEAKVGGIRAIVVESTFDSYLAIAKEKAPGIVADALVSDDLSPNAMVADLSPISILVIHGTADRGVPYARGKSLYDQAKQPKTLWTIQGGQHTQAFTTYADTYRPRLIVFFKECLTNEEKKMPPQKTGYLKVGGTIYKDRNNDGIVDYEETPDTGADGFSYYKIDQDFDGYYDVKRKVGGIAGIQEETKIHEKVSPVKGLKHTEQE